MQDGVYAQHEAAFSRVSAFVVLKDGELVARIAFKFPADGASRLYAYVHWFGLDMARGFATGYGYDKKSAACASAASKIMGLTPCNMTDNDCHAAMAFRTALVKDDGHYWDSRLRSAGFVVLQAV